MTERLVSISMCLACPYFLEDTVGKSCLLCEKKFDDSFEGNSIPDWCELPKSGELPEWLIEEIQSQIDCGGPFYNDIQIGYEKALEWVLSLRKPGEKA